MGGRTSPPKTNFQHKQHIPNGVILVLDSDVNDDDDINSNNNNNIPIMVPQMGSRKVGVYEDLTPTFVTILKADTRDGLNGSILDVLRFPVTRIRLFLTVAINFFCSVVYYGLSLNVVNLGTNLYLNVTLNAVAEMPAYLITALVLDRLGRKPLAIWTMWFSGIFCLAGSLMKGDGAWKVVQMVCGVLGIFSMAGTYNLLYVYSMELFPTVVRNAALGCATQAIHMGAILAPIVVVLGGGIPFVAFGICGIAGRFLVLYLPETLNRPLYDTMAGLQQGEAKPGLAA